MFFFEILIFILTYRTVVLNLRLAIHKQVYFNPSYSSSCQVKFIDKTVVLNWTRIKIILIIFQFLILGDE